MWISRNGVERRSAVDPNPAFHVNGDPDPDPGFDRQKLKKKKIQAEKEIQSGLLCKQYSLHKIR